MTPIMFVHGGAESIPDDRVAGKLAGVKRAAKFGYDVLIKGGSAVDAVEAAINSMEDNDAFNAGNGSCLNIEGEIEMDASIMDGKTLRSGAVSGVRDIPNPISLARLVMEKTRHVFIAGMGTSIFAKQMEMPTVSPTCLITDYAKKCLDEFKKSGGDSSAEFGGKPKGAGGTVGAVAMDQKGNVAAGTSTGGTIGKMVGRVGDSCIVGGGTYADYRVGAVSATGHGETIAKYCLSHSIIKDMENGMTVQDATEENLKKMTKIFKNSGGAITISACGEPGLYFTTSRMAWALKAGKEFRYGVDYGQDDCEMGT